MKGGIITRFVGLRIKFVTGHTAQAQVKTGRLPAAKGVLGQNVSDYIGNRRGKV